MLRYGMKYVDTGAAFYELRHRELQIKRLKAKAEKLGYRVHPNTGSRPNKHQFSGEKSEKGRKVKDPHRSVDWLYLSCGDCDETVCSLLSVFVVCV